MINLIDTPDDRIKQNIVLKILQSIWWKQISFTLSESDNIIAHLSIFECSVEDDLFVQFRHCEFW